MSRNIGMVNVEIVVSSVVVNEIFIFKGFHWVESDDMDIDDIMTEM